jgi:hypothetical protein
MMMMVPDWQDIQTDLTRPQSSMQIKFPIIHADLVSSMQIISRITHLNWTDGSVAAGGNQDVAMGMCHFGRTVIGP